MGARILLVEDDFYLRDGLCELLGKEGYEVSSGKDLCEARKLLPSKIWDLLILDMMLPDGSGLELCTQVRKSGNDVPILFLTALDEEYQIVRGLDAGADDYVTKPFKMLEFLSRVRALLRRRTSTVLRNLDTEIDIAAGHAKIGDVEVDLTPTEFQLLRVLFSNKGTTVTRSQLLQRIWDCDGDYIDDNTLSVHMSRLREKIGPNHIVTVRGIGYRWEDAV